jgi:prepilin-type N-terminal cleavage/methylation domain-containing protein
MILHSIFIRKSRAFTLIEIIAVIVIISVLSSLSYVQYTRVRERTIAERARLDFLSIESALEIWQVKTPNRPMATTLSGAAGLNQLFGLNISDEYFDYFFTPNPMLPPMFGGLPIGAVRRPTSAYTIIIRSASVMEKPCCQGDCYQVFPPCN